MRNSRENSAICAANLHTEVQGRMDGAPEEIRTPDPQIRSLVLYPAELRARFLRGGEPMHRGGLRQASAAGGRTGLLAAPGAATPTRLHPGKAVGDFRCRFVRVTYISAAAGASGSGFHDRSPSFGSIASHRPSPAPTRIFPNMPHLLLLSGTVPLVNTQGQAAFGIRLVRAWGIGGTIRS